MSDLGVDPITMDLIIEAVRQAVPRAVATAPTLRIRPGTVTSVDPTESLAEVLIDGTTEPEDVVGASMLYPTGIFPGDRVMVLFAPPSGAYIVGRRGGNFDPWHAVGDTDEPAFNTGWGNNAGTSTLNSNAPAFVSFRRHGRMVELRGQASRSSGSATAIFTLPPAYCPQNDMIVPAVGALGSYSPAGIERSGEVSAISGAVLVLDGIMFSVGVPESGSE